MKICTIQNGKVLDGADVEKLSIQGDDYPVITIGEIGPGRLKAVLLVEFMIDKQHQEWMEKGTIKINSVSVEKNNYDRYVLIASDNNYVDNEKEIICVFRTHIGSRGSNSHTGDNIDNSLRKYKRFPGTIISRGKIAQGGAGKMGSGEQIVAIMPPNCVFCTQYSKKLYKGPKVFYYKWDSHYYHWNGKALIGGITLQNRYALNIF
ncbi:MAG TPA: hypothetical protein VFD55_02695 [Candidatus Angelobacter sp.]|nr:hypothetical protein [Candidatus Angelobacter sp.]